MKVRVHVFLKDSVFDPQGSAVQNSLVQMGFKKVEKVRIGKAIDLEINSQSADEAKREASKMCEKLLSNPVIESFRCEVLTP